MQPDDVEPVGTGDDDDAERIPTVPRLPELPQPPEVKYVRPTLGSPKGSGSQGAPGDGSFSGSGRMDSASVGRIGAGLSAGVMFAASVIVGIIAGIYIDRHWPRVAPWGTMIMMLVGMAAGFLNLYRLVVVNDQKKK